MKIVVTGGAGFVGSHVVDKLVSWNKEVIVIDNLATGNRFNVNPKAKLVEEDLFTVDPIQADSVIHCAATADISRNWHSDRGRRRLYDNNIDRTIDLLEACGKGRVKSFTFVSTAAVYGKGASSMDADAHPIHAQSPYAATKIAGEALCQAYAHKYGWRYSCVRMVSCVGARYKHGHIADFVRMAKEGIIRTLDNGHALKPYIHVGDAAHRIASCAVNELSEGNRIATGCMWGIRDTISEMSKIRHVHVQYADAESGWVGDPQGLRMTNTITASRVAEGVRDALRSLGWS